MPLAVNISANNLLDPPFADLLAALLREHGLPPALLELEVTETAVMRHPETLLKRLQAIRRLGVALSIDDFGTGYASLAHLKQLPVTALKIDRSFVGDLVANDADRRIVNASIQLAHGFGSQVIAEGVESAEVAALLRDFGCDLAQGFHDARPLPAREIEAQWLRRPHAEPALPA